MQPTRPVGLLLALSVSWFGAARGCLFDGCGSEECNRAPPPSPAPPHIILNLLNHTTFFQPMQRIVVQPVQTCSKAGEPVAVGWVGGGGQVESLVAGALLCWLLLVDRA